MATTSTSSSTTSSSTSTTSTSTTSTSTTTTTYLPYPDLKDNPSDLDLYPVSTATLPGAGNIIETTLSAGITIANPGVAATLQLTSTTNFPPYGFVVIQHNSTFEIVRYEGLDAAPVGVVVKERGYGSTSAMAADSGDKVWLVDASYYSDIKSAYLVRLMREHNALGQHRTDEIRAKDATGLKLYEDGGKGIFIQDATGNVGIGTAVPAVKFVVQQSSGTLQARIENTGAGGRAIFEVKGDSAFFDMRAHGTTYSETLFGMAVADTSMIMGRHGKLLIGTYENEDFVLGTNNTERIRIQNDGDVGIGVTDPDTLLELYKVGTQLKLSGGAADYATFAVAADGTLTIATVDDTAAEGDIILMPDGDVGIGTTVPAALLDISGSTSGYINQIVQNRNEAVNSGSRILFRTGPAGAGLASANIFGELRGIITQADPGTLKGELAFYTNRGDSSQEAMRIDDSGNVGIGIATSLLGKTHIDQSSTSAAIPPLVLDQADLSEELIKFITTIGVGNPIEAVDGKTLTTTHFIRVEIPGPAYVYIPVGTIA